MCLSTTGGAHRGYVALNTTGSCAAEQRWNARDWRCMPAGAQSGIALLGEAAAEAGRSGTRRIAAPLAGMI